LESTALETKILFTSDLHASDTFFLKALSMAKRLSVDILFMSGDLTGKAIVPIVKVGDHYVSKFFGDDYTLKEADIAEFQQKVRNVGYYYYHCSKEEYDKLREDPSNVEKLFDVAMRNQLEGWIKKLDEVLPKALRVVMNPGNDDHFSVDDVLKNSERVMYTEGIVADLDDAHKMISCDWVNPTPWNSPRECSEAELEKKVRAEFQKVSSTERLVCDIHVPPFGTQLDLAPKLDKNLKPKTFFGQPVMDHVGSKAVYKVLKELQPKLALHGHIHESAGICRIGRTLCVNPGSEYVEGIMHGYYLKLTPDSVDYQPTVGG
jgi:Icc-related predicted phosphoesterase